VTGPLEPGGGRAFRWVLVLVALAGLLSALSLVLGGPDGAP
jgi:hypothetical protein